MIRNTRRVLTIVFLTASAAAVGLVLWRARLWQSRYHCIQSLNDMSVMIMEFDATGPSRANTQAPHLSSPQFRRRVILPRRAGDSELVTIVNAVRGLGDERPLEVYAGDSRITDVGIAQFATLPLLSELRLDGSHITGDGLLSLQNVRSLIVLNLWGIRLGRDASWAIGRLSSLEDLELGSSTVEGGDLLNLRELGELKRLGLSRTKITGDGFEVLASLERLVEIDVSDTLLSDESLRYFATAQNLRIVNLANTGISDRGIAHLAECSQLEVLDLSRNDGRLSNRALATVGMLASLKKLDIEGDEIDDGGAYSLGQLRELEELSIFGTNITDHGLAHLETLSHLRILNLWYMDLVTDRAVARLRMALPAATIQVVR